MTIRTAGYEDRAAILALAIAMGGHEDLTEVADPLRRLGGLIARSDVAIIVAETDGAIVGYAELHARATSIATRYHAWLAALAVGAGARGRGIGGRLLRALDSAAITLGCDEIVLESNVVRNRAHQFYRQNGYGERSTARRFGRDVRNDGIELADRFLAAAARAARAVGDAIAGWQAIDPIGLGADGAPTNAADAVAEATAVAELSGLGLPIVSEESGLIGTPPGRGDYWIALDPLDGSRNFRAGLAPWAIALGLVRDGRAEAGYVADLGGGRRWWAKSGFGAWVDGRPATPCRSGLVATVAIGPGDSLPQAPSGTARWRISGSTATDLCRVADGTLGAFVDLEGRAVHVHDLAGPSAILREAGAALYTASGEHPELVPNPATVIALIAAADDSLARSML